MIAVTLTQLIGNTNYLCRVVMWEIVNDDFSTWGLNNRDHDIILKVSNRVQRIRQAGRRRVSSFFKYILTVKL